MLLLTKSKGHKSNSPYSELPNHLQTKSNLHISIPQSQLLCIKSCQMGDPVDQATNSELRFDEKIATNKQIKTRSDCMKKVIQSA